MAARPAAAAKTMEPPMVAAPAVTTLGLADVVLVLFLAAAVVYPVGNATPVAGHVTATVS